MNRENGLGSVLSIVENTKRGEWSIAGPMAVFVVQNNITPLFQAVAEMLIRVDPWILFGSSMQQTYVPLVAFAVSSNKQFSALLEETIHQHVREGDFNVYGNEVDDLFQAASYIQRRETYMWLFECCGDNTVADYLIRNGFYGTVDPLLVNMLLTPQMNDCFEKFAEEFTLSNSDFARGILAALYLATHHPNQHSAGKLLRVLEQHEHFHPAHPYRTFIDHAPWVLYLPGELFTRGEIRHSGEHTVKTVEGRMLAYLWSIVFSGPAKPQRRITGTDGHEPNPLVALCGHEGVVLYDDVKLFPHASKNLFDAGVLTLPKLVESINACAALRETQIVERMFALMPTVVAYTMGDAGVGKTTMLHMVENVLTAVENIVPKNVFTRVVHALILLLGGTKGCDIRHVLTMVDDPYGDDFEAVLCLSKTDPVGAVCGFSELLINGRDRCSDLMNMLTDCSTVSGNNPRNNWGSMG